MAKKTKPLARADGNATSFCWLYHWCGTHKGRFSVSRFDVNFRSHLVALGEVETADSFKLYFARWTKDLGNYALVNHAKDICGDLAIKHGELSVRWFESPCGKPSVVVPQSPLTSVSDFQAWFGSLREKAKYDLLSRDKTPTGADAAMLWIDVRRALIWLESNGIPVHSYKQIMGKVRDVVTWIAERNTDEPRFDEALTELENLLRISMATERPDKLTLAPLSISQEERDRFAKRRHEAEAWERTNAIRKTLCESWDRIYSSDWNTIAIGLRDFASRVIEFGLSERVDRMIEAMRDDKRVWAWKFVKHALDEPVKQLSAHLKGRAKVVGTDWKSVFNQDLPQSFFTDDTGSYIVPPTKESSSTQTTKKKMKSALAAEIAEQLRRNDASHKGWTVDEWALKIAANAQLMTGDEWSCSVSTASKTEAYQETIEATGRSRRGRSVRANSAFSKKLEATTIGKSSDVLEDLASKEEQPAIDAIMASGMTDKAKADTIKKVKEGEMSVGNAIQVAKMHPKSKKRSIRESRE